MKLRILKEDKDIVRAKRKKFWRILSTITVFTGALLGFYSLIQVNANENMASPYQSIFSPENPLPLPSKSSQTVKAKERPSWIDIPSINVFANVVDLGLNPDGSLQVPQRKFNAGWYKMGAIPGQKGTSVIAGHVDSGIGPAVFYRLKDLKQGDIVKVLKEDGTEAVFRVDKKEVYSQDNFPSELVYKNTDKSSLRLITCSGDYSLDEEEYSDNLVVYASLAQ